MHNLLMTTRQLLLDLVHHPLLLRLTISSSFGSSSTISSSCSSSTMAGPSSSSTIASSGSGSSSSSTVACSSSSMPLSLNGLPILISFLMPRQLLLNLLLQPLLPPSSHSIILRRAGTGASRAVQDARLLLVLLRVHHLGSATCACSGADSSASPCASSGARHSRFVAVALLPDWVSVSVRHLVSELVRPTPLLSVLPVLSELIHLSLLLRFDERLAFSISLRKPLSLLLFFLPTSLLAISIILFLLACNGFSLGFFCIPINTPSLSRSVPSTLDKKSLIRAINEEIPLAIKPNFHNIIRLPKTPPIPNKRAIRRRIRSLRRLKFLQPNNQSLSFAARATQFLDRSCSSRFFMTWISPLDSFGKREIFSIETLFKLHPNACLLIVSHSLDSSKGRTLLRPFETNGFKVAALSPNYPYIFKDTPAENWFVKLRKGNVDPGEVPIGQNLSNLLRLVLLYKYGGVYVDTDVIFLKSFINLKNAIGVQTIDPETGNWTRLNNAVMVFEEKHRLLYSFIEEFARTFDGNKWGYNGPYLVSRVVLREMEKVGFEFTVLPQEAFYPLSWNKIGELFKEPEDDDEHSWVEEKIRWIEKESYVLHLWNRQSRILKIEGNSVLSRLMSKRCLFCNSSVLVM